MLHSRKVHLTKLWVFGFVLACQAFAVEFRAASFNIGAHFNAEGNPDYSLGAPGTLDHESVRSILFRIDADIVALQEVAPADLAGEPDHLDRLASSLGYGHVYKSSVSGDPPLSGPLDTSLRNVFLSRHPFIFTTAIRSPEGAKDLTRLSPVVKVDIPGSNRDPTLVSAHLKSGTALSDRFRRTVEMRRLTGYLTAQGITSDDNFLFLGDFNLSSINRTFDAPPAGLPPSFILGADIVFPISYSTNPLSYFSSPGVARIVAKQLDGSVVTFPASGSTIDLFLASPAFAGRPLATEIYNSSLDSSNDSGLQKAGNPLEAGVSSAASDHLAIFGDFELDENFPNLTLTLSPSSVAEDSPDGSVVLTVSLPQAATSNLRVDLASDNPSAGFPLASHLDIPAGSLAGSIGIKTTRNFVTDFGRSVTISATAPGYDPSAAVLQVTNVDGPYVFTTPGGMISESFRDFDGSHDPTPWRTSGGAWNGVESGASKARGFRSYGIPPDGSLGHLANEGSSSATADFINRSGTTLTALKISYTPEQWRATTGGTLDRIEVSILSGNSSLPVPALDFVSTNDLPTGPIAGGGSTVKTAIVGGLSVLPGQTFQIQFTFVAGVGGGPIPSQAFINEFHYDNAGSDAGEFVEIVTGEGFSQQPENVTLTLYNGANGAAYGSHLLSTFTQAADTASGHRIYSKFIPAIQNGPDGFALSENGLLTQFISYGGSFVATSGIASGQTSIGIGVIQTSENVGEAAIGLTGTGGSKSDFIWSKQKSIPHSPGLPNANQIFTSPPQPQGLAFDNLVVTFLTDTDGDGFADEVDSDDDGDGSVDADEFVLGTDPLDSGSRYVVAFERPSSSLLRISFPTSISRNYTIEESLNLMEWSNVATYSGTGATQAIDLPISAAFSQKFYRVRVTVH